MLMFLPCEDILLEEDESVVNFKLDEHNTGWVFRLEPNGTWRRMCWLPHKRRGRGLAAMAFWGQRLAIGSDNGWTTILDFSRV
jgi:hypothetical protein